ncbi:MAG: DNA-binding protein WhiA [Eubacteriales bacterium]|nr:DNA-binding protein WhiA [Eubacteriales bacterium]
MSFSGTVKEELAQKVESARHCQIAELAAILNTCARTQKQENGCFSLVLQTENEAVARKYFTLLRKAFNINTEILIQKKVFLKKGNAYFVEITSEEEVRKLLQSTKLMAAAEAGCLQGTGVNPVVVQKNCCKRAFIRGAFLASGSISDPEKGYHFEIVCSAEEKAMQLRDMIQSFEIDAKIVRRKRMFVVYVKEGSQIVDLLAIMGADRALMNLENIRIIKEMRNSINRKVNCETANINKTVNAAVKQAEDIRLIDQTIGLDSLSSTLEETARLRIQFPEATLKELGMMLTPKVGKSGVNHRLRRLGEIADGLRGGSEEELL